MSLTVEESNFLRFYYLNLKVATKAVRVYFDHIHRQGRLEWKLKKNETHLKSRDNLITSHQINIVYPSSGHIVNSDQFDTTLMICLLRNMKPYTVEYANDKGWDKFPPATDTSYLADLARVKWYRNFVSHHKGELTAADFNWHCRNLEPAIGRLGGQTLLIEARSAQHVILDTSLKDMLLELRNCEKSLQGMTDKINSHQLSLDLLTTNEEELVEKIHKMEAVTQELKTKLSDYKGTIDACTKELETCKNDIKTNKEIMKGLQNQSDKKQNEIENLITRIDKLEIEYEQHDKMLKEHGEHLVMHDGQVIQLQEHLVMHDGQLEKCEKQIHDIKEKQHDTDVTSVRSKQKRLEDDIKALMKEDVREGTFVTTKSVADGLALLKRNGVLLITGHAGTGKTRIGRHVLHMFCSEATSYKCIKLNTLDEWADMVNRDEKVAVIIDDIFGETNCIYKKGKDKPILDEVYAYVRKDNIKVIITIRDTVKRHCQKMFDDHRLFQFDFINLSLGKYVLSLDEKKAILTKYMNTVRQLYYTDNVGFSKHNGDTILSESEVLKIIGENTVIGFPLVVYQFTHNDKYYRLGSSFFDRPTDVMLKEMNEIRKKSEEQYMIQYAVMVYTAINGNQIDPYDKKIVLKITDMIEGIYRKKIELLKCHISDAVDELKGSYLVYIPNRRSYKLHHPILQESVILSFAHVDDENIDKIIPLISWSFFLKMVKPESYTEKEGEVVLKVQTNSYRILADRLVDLYIAECRTYGFHNFLQNLCNTEIFQQEYGPLLPLLLKAFENEDLKDKHTENMKRSGEMDIFHSYLLQMKVKDIFLANLLITLAKLEGKLDIYNFVLETLKEIAITMSNHFTYDYIKSALISSLYAICSTKDVRSVKATLDIVVEHKIPVLLDQGVELTNNVPNFPLICDFLDRKQYIYLAVCLKIAYEVFNSPVLEFLLSKYTPNPFDINSFFKMVYNDAKKGSMIKIFRQNDGKHLQWMLEKYQEQVFDDPNFILRTACKYQMFDTVEYVASVCKTFDAMPCLQAFVEKPNIILVHEVFFNKKLFDFLMKRIKMTSKDLSPVVQSVIKKQHVPDYMFDSFLPVCINNANLLTLACENGHKYLVSLIIESSKIEHLNIQLALMAACKQSERNYHDAANIEIKKFDVVEYIVDKNGYKQFDFKAVSKEACSSKYFKIIEWLVQKIDTSRLDVYAIIDSALDHKRSDILEHMMNKIEIESLDKQKVLKSLTEHYTADLSSTLLDIVRTIWNRTEKKDALQFEEIVNIAYERNCFELLLWIHKNCHQHISIDACRVLLSACQDGSAEIAKSIHHACEQKSLYIDGGSLFISACSKTFRNIIKQEQRREMVNTLKDMLNWILGTFKIKRSSILSGVLKLIMVDNKIRNELNNVVVYILDKFSSCLKTKDMKKIMDKSLQQNYYFLVNWLLQERSYCSFDKQTILDNACSNAEIETIKMLSQSFCNLDINQAMTNAFTSPFSRYGENPFELSGFNNDHSVACLDFLKNEMDKVDRVSIDFKTIVTKVCKGEKMSDNIMTWILLKLPLDQIPINKVLITCCLQSKIHHVKYIFHKVANEKLDVKGAFVNSCMAKPSEIMRLIKYNLLEKDTIVIDDELLQAKNDEPMFLLIVDYLFQMTNDKDSYISLVFNEIFKNNKFELILYFLQAGYCRDNNMKDLLEEACKYGYVRLVQWILAHNEHKELDIKSAFRLACDGTNHGYLQLLTERVNHVMCVALLWHYTHDKSMLEIDTSFNTITPSQSNMSDDGMKTWLLYMKNIKQRICKSDSTLLLNTEEIIYQRSQQVHDGQCCLEALQDHDDLNSRDEQDECPSQRKECV